MSETVLLATSAQRVQDFLKQRGISARVLELATSVRTAQEAAQSIGCTVAQIAKSLIFKTAQTQRPVLVIASGANRVNEHKLEAYVGEGIVKADADFTRAVTGYAIGGIPPIAHQQRIELVFIDEDLTRLDDVWTAAGTPHAVFNIKTEDLLKLVLGKVLSIR